MAQRKTKPRLGAGPSEISPGVFVGGWKDAAEFHGQRICVTEDAPDGPIPAEARRAIYDPTKDAPIRSNLDEVAQLTRDARARGEPVLLFCGHGVRRGPLAGAWYLHRSESIPLDAAYERIRKVRPQIEHVREWVGDSRSLDETSPPSSSGRRRR